MIKKLLLLAAVALPLFASAQTMKIGLVNTTDIFAQMPDTKEAENTLKALNDKYQAEVQSLLTEIQKLEDELKALPEDTPKAIQESRYNNYMEKRQKLETFAQQAEQDVNKKQQELMQPIMQKISQAIEAVGKEGNFSLIQELQGSLYYGAPVQDITPQVKAKLNLK